MLIAPESLTLALQALPPIKTIVRVETISLKQSLPGDATLLVGAISAFIVERS